MFITTAVLWAIIQVSSTPICMVQCTHLITTGGTPTCIIKGLACWLTLCILEKIICNFTNSVQISFIQTLKLIAFPWTIQYDGVNVKMFWWLMKKINFWLSAGRVASYLQRSLSAQVNGGPDANTDRLKQSISAVRSSGGFPGNVWGLGATYIRDLTVILFSFFSDMIYSVLKDSHEGCWCSNKSKTSTHWSLNKMHSRPTIQLFRQRFMYFTYLTILQIQISEREFQL